GWLAPVVVFTPARNLDLTQVQVRAGDYAPEQLANVMMSGGLIIEDATAEYERLCRGAPAIAFCVTIEHSQLVAAAFRARGFRAEHVDGSTPREQRRALIDGLRNGSVEVLCNCGLSLKVSTCLGSNASSGYGRHVLSLCTCRRTWRGGSITMPLASRLRSLK